MSTAQKILSTYQQTTETKQASQNWMWGIGAAAFVAALFFVVELKKLKGAK